ncbi:gamma-glutamylcyclotransferase [Paracoccus shanxieyensis]|uniref:glutathione-specific gamma-glutamylcyclotransferase n=1 Tax=Paracoccus shanxieyensis TaxID=2675752 RepID=A0A6L6IW94_9RHOB|nr:gamma-glutamylcyclotransferase [Paracoccus shanxieyensis]MTH64776.1 gamma-glutamylcyclotransferase [Paracoccus shanxieyensis]MTH87991.1 gamma-glutamylcyclotransferase [Paracoccus shanxieyensis]
MRDEQPKAWVFAYGSLMWQPDFPVATRQIARLEGFARRFCMQSVVHRGTPDAPGLVLALDEEPGTHCLGLALGVLARDWDTVLAGLRERELPTQAYAERLVPLVLADGRAVEAVAYVMRQDHAQYCRDLDLDQQAQIIARSVGGRGPNADYLMNTAAHLGTLGIDDPDIAELARRVAAIRGAQAGQR